MDNLFSESNLDSISIVHLAEAVHRRVRKIQLPAFQRDAVWDERRVELLWDSIFRGFPIGTMLFARSSEDVIVKLPTIARTGYAKTNLPTEKTEFVIIDGQQRTNAIALGLTPWDETHTARLWIDLGPPVVRTNKEIYPFHVCSWPRPWGENATSAMQRDALKKLELEKIPERGGRLKTTWPLRAAVPVPLAELTKMLRESKRPSWQTLVPEAILNNRKLIPRDDLSDFLQRLAKSLEYQVPLFLTTKSGINDLGIIFDRLNRQGVPLSAEDLFFSALKIKWPDAHDLVWQIYDDQETGRFMQPTKIVHLSTRLVAADRDDGDLTSLDREEFVRRFDPPKDSPGIQKTPYLLDLQNLLTELAPGHNVGRLTYYLSHARKALSYRPDNPTDPGLPSTLLRTLRWRVWHTITAWIATHEGHVDDFSRIEMIRYVLLDHFFTKSTSTRLTRYPFQTAFNAKESFPGRDIYRYLRENDLLTPASLLSPEDYRIAVVEADLPQWEKVQNEWHLIMWAQRRYFAEWFSDFDPSLYRKDADLPYHADHIIPRAHLNMGGMKNWHLLPQVFKDWREAVLWSAGNIRYWPKGLNIQDSDNNLKRKFLLGTSSEPTPSESDSYLRTYGLTTIGEVRLASYISEDHIEDWDIASNRGREEWDFKKDWRDEERIRAFRRATDVRRVNAYKEFFEQVGYDSWLEMDTQPLINNR